MKTLFKYILAAAMTLSFAACQEKEQYAPGDPDPLDCHGVFFSQTQAGDYEFTPDEKRTLTFTVERTLDIEEAYVPYELISSEEGFFEVEDEFLYFDEDQKSAEFKVNFSDDFEPGKKYTCTIKVTDPQYVSSYGLSSNELTFSVTIVEWEYLGEGLWRDDFYTSFCKEVLNWDVEVPYYEKPVKIYQRVDYPGYYKIDAVYTADYVSYISDGSDRYAESYADLCPGGSIYVNAIDPTKVYIDAQLAFNHSSYGGIYIASYVSEVFLDAGDVYGTLKDGSITFPKSGLVAYVPAAGGFAYANLSGKHRIVLPGHKGYDFSVSVETGSTDKGVLPMTFTLGDDVAKVEYKVFEGHLTDVDLVSKLEDVKSHNNVTTVTKSGDYEFTTDKTGFYTLIACSYDKDGNFKEYTSVKFGYDTSTDPRDVDVHIGLIVSDKYAGAGLTKENSMEFYIYGTDLVDVRYAIYKKVNYDDFSDVIDVEFKLYGQSLGREDLELANGIGYNGLLGAMDAGTEYILMVYADNGYHTTVTTCTASTAGVFNPLDAEFTIYDMPERLQPSKEEYFKSWDVWSIDVLSEESEEVVWERTKRATAVISEDADLMYDANGKLTENPDKAETIFDLVKVNGMYPNAAAKYGFEDEIQFNYYDGFIYTMRAAIEPCKYNGSTIYPTSAYWYIYANTFNTYWEDGAMVGGFVNEAKDVVAFVGNPASTAGESGLSYVAMLLGYFLDSSYEGDFALIKEDCHVYPLLVSPEAEYGKVMESKLKAPAACNVVSNELSKARSNYVETDNGYIMSTIDRVKGVPYNYAENLVNGVVPTVEPASVEFEMTPVDKVEMTSKDVDFFKAVLK